MENGYEIINNLFVRKSIEHEVIMLTEDCIGIVAGVKPLTPRVMDVVLQLKCISRVGVGMDSVDLDYTKASTDLHERFKVFVTFCNAYRKGIDHILGKL